MKNLLLASFALLSITSQAQTLYVPSGTSGVGTSSNSNVGVGTNNPQELLYTSGGNVGVHQAGTYLDPWGKWIRVGSSYSSSYPLYLGSNKHGISNVWDSDGVFFGLSDEGSNRKDAIIAWGDDADDNLRFLFNNNELMRVNSAGVMSLGLTTPGPQARLHVYEPGSSASSWRGRIVSSGSTSAVVTGEYSGKAILGGHTSALDAWSDLFLQFGGGNVGIGSLTASQKLDVNGNVKFNDKAYFGNWVLGATGQWPSNPGFMYTGGDETFGFGSTGGQISIQIDGAFRQQEAGKINYFMDKVGIGTTNPTEKLHVYGSNPDNEVAIRVENTDSNVASFAPVQFKTGISSSIWQTFARNNDFFIGIASVADYVTVKYGGNVGIGTSNPGSYKLAVEGKIGAREVNVIATNPWPDYVFEKNYKLPSLEEIKNYIDQNQHLPEVPSAKEVEKNGVNVGEMNALLLKKIEELTLYMIEQNKVIETIKKENSDAKAQMKNMQSEIDLLKK